MRTKLKNTSPFALISKKITTFAIVFNHLLFRDLDGYKTQKAPMDDHRGLSIFIVNAILRDKLGYYADHAKKDSSFEKITKGARTDN